MKQTVQNQEKSVFLREFFYKKEIFQKLLDKNVKKQVSFFGKRYGHGTEYFVKLAGLILKRQSEVGAVKYHVKSWWKFPWEEVAKIFPKVGRRARKDYKRMQQLAIPLVRMVAPMVVYKELIVKTLTTQEQKEYGQRLLASKSNQEEYASITQEMWSLIESRLGRQEFERLLKKCQYESVKEATDMTFDSVNYYKQEIRGVEE